MPTIPAMSPDRFPLLIRFLGQHMALGMAIGVLVASLLIFTNTAGLKDLLVEAETPATGIFLLYVFNALTFGSVVMGVGIMTLPFDEKAPDDETSSRRDGDSPVRR